MADEKKLDRREFLKSTAVKIPVTLAGITLLSLVPGLLGVKDARADCSCNRVCTAKGDAAQ
jgi:hypothetical protein